MITIRTNYNEAHSISYLVSCTCGHVQECYDLLATSEILLGHLEWHESKLRMNMDRFTRAAFIERVRLMLERTGVCRDSHFCIQRAKEISQETVHPLENVLSDTLDMHLKMGKCSAPREEPTD